MRFRKYKAAVSADIKSFFYQILVCKYDQDALRFIWWKDSDPMKAIEHWCMTRPPFGIKTACSN